RSPVGRVSIEGGRLLTRSLTLIAVSAAAVALTAAAGAQRAVAPTLLGTVGPGFTISLTLHGKKVTTLPHGVYRFSIADRGSIHNFVLQRLTGGKFMRALTGVPFVGSKTITLTLGPGRWKYFCAGHG